MERDGLVFAARRGARMSLPLMWEFPGGKVEEGESPQEALHRELEEELCVRIHLTGELPPSTHAYPGLVVTLHPFRCRIVSGEITLTEHAEGRWVAPAELPSLDFAPADLPIITRYLESLR